MSFLQERQVTNVSEELPSFDRFLTALHHEEPDRVPLAEASIDPEIKESFMGRPVQTLEDDVEFWVAAGYDFIVL